MLEKRVIKIEPHLEKKKKKTMLETYERKEYYQLTSFMWFDISVC